ncbi:MAG: PAS domain-containing sensor histidine kinase [Bacteroidota bacterium]
MEEIKSELETLRSENELLKEKLDKTNQLPVDLSILKKALNNISDSVFILNTDRFFLFTNNSFNKTYGYDDNGIIGKHASVIYAEKTGKDKFQEIFQNIIESGWEGEVYHRKKNGEEFPVYITATVIKGFAGGFDAIFGVSKDLTEHVEKEKSLHTAINKYQNLFQELRNVIYESSPDGKLLDINPAGVELFGFDSKEELLNVNIAKDLYVNPKDREALKSEIEKNGFIKNYELKVKNKSGDHIVVLETSTIIKDNSGNTIAYQGILRDVTENKKREELMNKYVSDLAEVNMQLRNSEIELKKLNAEKDKFFSIIAHDLKSPFNSLLNLSEFLVEDIADLSMEEVKSFSREINRSANHVYNHIVNLLQWSQIRMGGLELVEENVALSSFINNTITLIEGNAAKKDISVKNDVDTRLFFKGDRNMINSVFLNLISNSIKFTDRGGMIRISAESDDDMITIMVMDNGIGIREENLERIFRIDEHFTTSGTSDELGTGLGLILCKELIEKNNGKIWVKSEEKVGTTFFFTLPKAEI